MASSLQLVCMSNREKHVWISKQPGKCCLDAIWGEWPASDFLLWACRHCPEWVVILCLDEWFRLHGIMRGADIHPISVGPTHGVLHLSFCKEQDSLPYLKRWRTSCDRSFVPCGIITSWQAPYRYVPLCHAGCRSRPQLRRAGGGCNARNWSTALHLEVDWAKSLSECSPPLWNRDMFQFTSHNVCCRTTNLTDIEVSLSGSSSCSGFSRVQVMFYWRIATV